MSFGGKYEKGEKNKIKGKKERKRYRSLWKVQR
jgi:hypothetical protein